MNFQHPHLVLGVLFLSVWLSASPQFVDAPPIELEAVLQGPPDLSLASLDGKALVLDFWATWCSPCLASIPHLNRLQATQDGEPIRFLSVSDEPRELVERFLKQRPIAGWVGLDFDRSMFRDYRVDGLPHTILIDRAGKIRLATHPLALNEKSLRDLIAGVQPDVPDLEKILTQTRPPRETTIEPSTVGRIGMQIQPGWRSISGAGVEVLISLAYNAHPLWIRYEGDLPEGTYDAVVVNDEDGEWMDVLAQALGDTFDLSFERITEERQVWVLRKGPGWESKLQRAESARSPALSKKGRLAALESLSFSRNIATLLDTVVVDESGLEGLWKLEVDYDPDRPESIGAALAEQLGLRLDLEKRPVEFLRVSRR